MDINLNDKITIQSLVDGFVDDGEKGVYAYGGKLNIRPPYQREFVYNDKDQKAVIESILQGHPLNVLYWVDREDGTYEVMDGQQRIMSICRFVKSKFSVQIDGTAKNFHNLKADKETINKILNYKLMIYFCKGDKKEKINWFRIINIAGKKLTDQEMLNAIYHGRWVTDAKGWFSKSGCQAQRIGSKHLSGDSNRQKYLETAIRWHIAFLQNKKITSVDEYMAKHEDDENAQELFDHFKNVIDWAKKLFPKLRTEMKSVNWGKLYSEFKDKPIDKDKINKEVDTLMKNSDIKRKSGIYPYVLTGIESYLNPRFFEDEDRRTIYERQEGKCNQCGNETEFGDMHADHIKAYSEGGKSVIENLQMLCQTCNLHKGAL